MDSHRPIIRPIIIGAAQFSDPQVTLETAMSPIDMLAQTAREAVKSSGGSSDFLSSIDTIALANILGWEASNPPELFANAIGAKNAKQVTSHVGGESALALTNRIASEIAAGESELGFVGGCNNLRAISLARNAGVRLDWSTESLEVPTTIGATKPGNSDAENEVGLFYPIQIYPIFENALRAARGQSLSEHREAMGEMFHSLTSVAAKNPYAWFPTERSAEELVEVTPVNRMISFPYPKYLNAIIATDQSAGVLIASQKMAKQLGIPEENWIYWRGGATEVEEPWHFSERPSFAEAPAMKTCHDTALANAGLRMDEIDLIDLYSCFPSAVSLACDALGISQDDPRGLTLTGGLPYAGGPGNSYSFHSLAVAVTKLREATKDAKGKVKENAIVTGNGWYLTKHSATIISRQPGPPGFKPSAAAATDATRTEWTAPPVKMIPLAEGPATVETYTIVHSRDGAPEQGIIIGRLTETNERFLANTEANPETLAELEKTELVGTKGTVRHEAGKNIFQPA